MRAKRTREIDSARKTDKNTHFECFGRIRAPRLVFRVPGSWCLRSRTTSQPGHAVRSCSSALGHMAAWDWADVQARLSRHKQHGRPYRPPCGTRQLAGAYQSGRGDTWHAKDGRSRFRAHPRWAPRVWAHLYYFRAPESWGLN